MRRNIIGCLLAALLLSGMAAADIISTINSAAGKSITTTSFAAFSSTTTVTIGTHPLWQPNNPDGSSALWISFADTGYNGLDFQPYQGANVVATVTDSFDGGIGDVLHLKIWSDDTAGVWLDGQLIFSPVFTQSTCSGQPIGCVPSDVGIIDLALVTDGPHTLKFDMYQVGTGTNTNSNPMGLLYTGTVTPEPASIFLLGAGFLGLAGLRRRR